MSVHFSMSQMSNFSSSRSLRNFYQIELFLEMFSLWTFCLSSSSSIHVVLTCPSIPVSLLSVLRSVPQGQGATNRRDEGRILVIICWSVSISRFNIHSRSNCRVGRVMLHILVAECPRDQRLSPAIATSDSITEFLQRAAKQCYCQPSTPSIRW
jgi:hypothetical protein